MTERLRQIAPVNVRGIAPAAVSAALPKFDWVAPGSLYVEEDYQRSLNEHSLTLIRRIVGKWSWAHIKPTICVQAAGGKLLVIDGQHTAIAALSHGGIPKIPVMIVTAETIMARAAAFISQNRDRLTLTPMHLHFAAAAAGDEVAVAVNEACAKAGITLMKYGRGTRGIYKIGETFSIGIIARVAKRFGVHSCARALKVMVDAKRAPVPAREIAAVSILLFDEKYRGKVDTFDLVTVLRSRTAADWTARAAQLASQSDTPNRAALAEVLFRALPKLKEKRVA